MTSSEAVSSALALDISRRCKSRSVVPCLGLPGMSYKEACRWLVLVLGLEVPRRSQTFNQG